MTCPASPKPSQPLRPLRASDRHEGPTVRCARPAAHRVGRLERRHEPGRGRGRGRERLAGILPLCRADAVSPSWPGGAAKRPSRTAACREASSGCDGASRRRAWDGAWYRRAYFDDGTPLGSSSNRECQIDSIAQSWSVLSGARQSGRAPVRRWTRWTHWLVREDRLVRLLDPPFDTSALEPGYIKGYVPGVRENGGQYTHAAVWAGHGLRWARRRRDAREAVEI